MMTLKEQAIEIIKELPQEKIPAVIIVLRGLQTLSHREEVNTPKSPSAIGLLSKYANPALIPLEKEAWGMAMEEKHGVN